MTRRPRTRPLVLGVAGGSGAGKSTVVREVVRRLGRARTAVIHHDAYYRDLAALGPEERSLVNFDDPDSLETALLVEHLDRLLSGQEVNVPVYDFVTHTRRPGPGEPILPSRVLVLDGMLVLADPRLRERMDLRVFVDTDDDVRLMRRLRRDTTLRGRTPESVLRQYERTVRPMYLEFVEPSKRHADLLVPGGGRNVEAVDAVVTRMEELLAASGQATPGRT